nr:hypothetical protein [Anaerolineae bacterium]
IRDTMLGIANVDDVLDGTLATEDARIQAIYQLGYVVGGDLSDILKIQVSIEDALMRAEERTLPRRGFSLTTQDRLGRLNRVVSDYAAEWPGHSAGRDPYDDPSGTGYGGLRHTAPYEGSWKAESGQCYLLSSNQEGLAVSTLVSDALNGSAQTAFMLAHTSKGEYAGVTFHVHDKDNLCFAAYYVDDDVIRLKSREGSTDTTLATSGTMSWTIDTWYYLKVMVFYSMAYVYTSTDGVTWTLVTWDTGGGELTGMADEAAAPGTVPSGKFGLIGYGYSEKDSYGDWEPEPWEPITPSDLPDTPSTALVWSMDQLAVTTDFDAEYPSWTDITPANCDYIHRVWKDHGGGYKVWMLGGETNTDTNEGLWYCSDVRTGSWSLVTSQDDLRSAAVTAGGEGSGVVACGISHSPGLFCAAERRGVSGNWGTAVHICNTSGIVNTWWSDDLDWIYYGSDGAGTYEMFKCYAYSYMSTTQVVYHNGAIYITGRGRWNPDAVVWTYSHGAYIKSTDGGYNWTVYTEHSGRYSDNRRPGSIGICGSRIYTIFRDTAEGDLMVFDLEDWEMVAPTGDIFQNYSSGAPSRYHPSAFYAPARASLDSDDYGYVWRDGYKMWYGEDIWEEKSGADARTPRAFTIYPKGASRAGFVLDVDDTNPPIVKWVDSGGAWDKTGNLMTTLGGSWSGSYGGGGGAQHSYHDNASLLFFWED